MRPPRSRPAAATALAAPISLFPAACGDTSATVGPQEEEEAVDLPAIFRLTIEDEWRAEAVYTAVMEDYGPVLSFRDIAAAEKRHARNIAALYEARGLAVPPSPWTPPTPAFQTRSQGAGAAGAPDGGSSGDGSA